MEKTMERGIESHAEFSHAEKWSQRLASKASRNLGGKFAKKAQVRGMLVGEDTYSCHVNVLSIFPITTT
jgi:hypothetical protein